MVRGLDYYNRTTFEICSTSLESAQNAIGGGGRYDGLVRSLGGPDTPAIGFSIGLERLVSCLENQSPQVMGRAHESHEPIIFLIDVTSSGKASQVFRDLSRSGINVARDYGDRSMKAQFKAADRSGAWVAVIIGDDELSRNSATIRALRDQEKLRALLQESVREKYDGRSCGRQDELESSGQVEIDISDIEVFFNKVFIPKFSRHTSLASQ